MLLLGIDDAGRGPLIGPMIMAGVLIDKDKEKELKKAGAKDSKLLLHPARIKIAEIVKSEARDFKIVKASPAEIDEAIFSEINLNTLEAKKMASIINSLNDGKKPTRVIVDCPSVNIPVWKKKLMEFIDRPNNLTVLCEHKADFNYPVVSAASILAKVEREEEVSKLKKEFSKYGNLGSGYPSDPITQDFLKKNGKNLRDSGIFRKSWSTWQSLFPERVIKKHGQKTLFDY